jgi:nucleotide-binding universal stress UspA family protein
VQVETHVLVMEDPARAIDEAAALYRADMIAVATHGRGPLGRLMRGSVAWRALAHSPVPVLLRHPDHGEHEALELQRRRVMMPLDGSPHAERALPVACAIAAASAAELLLVRVIPVAPGYVMIGAVYGSAVTAPSADEEDIRAYLAGVADSLPYPASTLVLTCGVSGSLIEAALTLDVTDIVMASHGRTGAARVVLGSVADDLVQHLHCPIVIVPTRVPEQVQSPEPDHPTRQLVTAPSL